ncbi:hypothetical protein D3C87_2130320 [compost metagenome]
MMATTISTAEMMIAASAKPFLTPALRLCTSATMPRISATSCTKNDSTNATMPSVLPGTGASAGAPYAAGGAASYTGGAAL